MSTKSTKTEAEIRAALGDRFMAKIVERDHGQASPCWDWTAGTNGAGRGRYWHNGRLILPYRLALAIRYGVELAELAGLNGCHECDNPACCNPFHAEPKSQSENMRDCVERGRIGGFVRDKLAARAAAIARTREKADHRYLDDRFAAAMAAE